MDRILQSAAAPETCPVSASVRSRADEEAYGAALIEDYLDHFCAPLIGTVPYQRRQELRRELACHLESLIEALEELGDTREEAVRDALRRFGDPAALGKQWGREWTRTTPDGELRAPLGVTLGFYSALTLLVSLLITNDWTLSRTEERILILFCTLVPALAGLLIGASTRGRSALGSFLGMFPLSVFTGFLFFVCTCLIPQTNDRAESTLGGLLVCQIVFWLPINTTFAALGGWMRRRVKFTPPRLALK